MKNSKLLLLTVVLLLTLTGCRTRTTVPVDPIPDENGETVSAVDQDCTILRIIDLHDFGVRHEESFVIGKGLKTGA